MQTSRISRFVSASIVIFIAFILIMGTQSSAFANTAENNNDVSRAQETAVVSDQDVSDNLQNQGENTEHEGVGDNNLDENDVNLDSESEKPCLSESDDSQAHVELLDVVVLPQELSDKIKQKGFVKISAEEFVVLAFKQPVETNIILLGANGRDYNTEQAIYIKAGTNTVQYVFGDRCIIPAYGVLSDKTITFVLADEASGNSAPTTSTKKVRLVETSDPSMIAPMFFSALGLTSLYFAKKKIRIVR